MLKYLAAALLALSVGLGIFAQHEHIKVQQLTVENITFKTAAETNLKAKEDADASCLVTVGTLNSYYKEQASNQTAQKATGDAILALPTLTVKESSNAVPTNNQTPTTKYADDDRLSPDTMRLLDAAYCYGDKDGCATPAR